MVALLLVFATLYSANNAMIRRLLVADFAAVAKSAGNVSAQALRQHKLTANAVDVLADHPELRLICIYDSAQRNVASWYKNGTEHCPPLLIATGVHIADFTVHISQPIMLQGEYVGMVYVEGELSLLKDFQRGAMVLFLATVLVAATSCWFSAWFSARCISAPLQAIQRQIECLKDHDIDFCPLPPHQPTRETAQLARSVVSLRSYLAMTMVPKTTIDHLRSWHWDILASLLARLRYRLPSDSPLLEEADDYALLLRIENGDKITQPQPFLLHELLDTSVQSVRHLSPRDAPVNLTASIHPAVPAQWMGHADALETLLRHLLAIGLKRARSGFVCLRMETLPQLDPSHTHRLRIHYEDSGPPMQQGQLQQRLSPRQDIVVTASIAPDISWLLVAGIVKYLGGSITSIGDGEQGMALEALLPMLVHAAPIVIPPASVSVSHARPPLLLVVEQDKEVRKNMAAVFAQLPVRAFMVETHAQAVEVAPILPFSAILLNAMQDKLGEDIARRFRHLMEDGVMAEIPLWVMLAPSSFIALDYWQKRGVSELLLQPLQLETLRRLCASLSPCEEGFYQQQDARLQRDLAATLHAEMPRLNRMLASQLAAAKSVLETPVQGNPPVQMVHTAHAVKSAALTLGYYRLAALMDQIEHAHLSHIFAAEPGNWRLVMELLEPAGFEALADAWPIEQIV